MVGQTTDKAIKSSMCKVLKACNDINVQSVSFPALGTGMQMGINHVLLHCLTDICIQTLPTFSDGFILNILDLN